MFDPIWQNITLIWSNPISRVLLIVSSVCLLFAYLLHGVCFSFGVEVEDDIND